jgi:hypothetical protein
MNGETTIRVLVLKGGERLPVLLDRASQQPLFDPLVYATSRLRGRAANTVQQHLVGLQILLNFCSERQIDLADRVRSGELFSTSELDGLVASTSRNRVRGPYKSVPRHLSRQTSANRLRAIRAYLAWMSARRLHELSASERFPERYRFARERLLLELQARLPSVRLQGGQRSGLTHKQRVQLLSAIEPGSLSNPWTGGGCRARNFLILRLLYDLGIRRGELLALRLEDVDVRQCRLSIRRRHDDPRDPRRRQPVAKTEERILELGADLAAGLSSYILKSRQSLPASRKHGFLFIDTRRGAPLSASGLDRVFTRLRTVGGLSTDLTSHVLRHDWNERFSVLMDEKGVKPGDEQRLRMYLQGWTWAGSAQRYNRRHIVKLANEALLTMQLRALHSGGDG